jgi:hypothetical protein
MQKKQVRFRINLSGTADVKTFASMKFETKVFFIYQNVDE